MGSRVSSFKKGGGFLDGVDATITGYEFSDKFAGKPYVAGKMKDNKTGRMIDKPHSLNCALSVRVDGATEDTSATLTVSKDFDLWDITDDGHTLTPVDDANLGGSSKFGIFIQSWEVAANQGAESDQFGDASFNYTPIIGSRVRLVQRPYSAEALASIKKLGGTEKQKGKDGKEYERRNLVVEQVYELAQPAAKSNGKAKPVNEARPLGTNKTAGKPNGKVAPPVDEQDIDELTKATLAEILEGAGGSITLKKLSLKALTTPLMKGNSQRDEVRALILSTDFLAQEDGWTYDADSQEVSVE